MKFVASLALAAVTLAFAAPASAQFAKPEDAIKYRQSAMYIMSQHFGRVASMANGRAPYDAKVAIDNAEIVAEMARLPWAAYGPGTDKGAPTRVKAEIWSEPAKFKEHNEKLMADSVKLLAAAKTNNLDNIKAAVGPLANNCKVCHDAFRSN